MQAEFPSQGASEPEADGWRQRSGLMAEPSQAAKIRFKRGLVLRQNSRIFGGDDLAIGSRSSKRVIVKLPSQPLTESDSCTVVTLKLLTFAIWKIGSARVRNMTGVEFREPGH
jgi:hypothetical protein